MDFGKIKRCGLCTAIAALAFSASCHAQYERTCVKRDFMDYYNNANYDEKKGVTCKNVWIRQKSWTV